MSTRSNTMKVYDDTHVFPESGRKSASGRTSDSAGRTAGNKAGSTRKKKASGNASYAAKRNSSSGKRSAAEGKRSSSSGKSSAAAGRKRSSSSKRSSSKNKKKSDKEKIDEINRYHDRKAYHTGIGLLIIIFVSVFLYMCFGGLCKNTGKIVTGFFFGIFGWFSWALPVYVMLIFLFFAANGRDRRVIRGTLCSASAIIALEGFIQIITDTEVLSEYYETRKVLHSSFDAFILSLKDIAAGGKVNGGMIAEFFISHEAKYIGTAGAILVQVAVMLIAVFIFYGMDAVAHIRKKNQYRQSMEKKISEVKEENGEYSDPDYNPVHAGKKIQIYDYTEDEGASSDSADTLTDIENNDISQGKNDLISSGNKKVRSKRTERFVKKKNAGQSPKKSAAYKNMNSEDATGHGDSENIDKAHSSTGQEYIRMDDVSYVIESDTPEPEKSDDTPASSSGSDSASERSIHSGYGSTEDITAFSDRRISADFDPLSGSTSASGRAKASGTSRAVRSAASGRKNAANATRRGTGRIPSDNAAGRNSSPSYSFKTSAVSDNTPVKKAAENYIYPSLDLLNEGGSEEEINEAHLREMAVRLEETLKRFGVDVTLGDVTHGPSVTRFELIPAPGVRVNRITSLIDDIKLSLAVSNIRIEAPIPGKSAVGVEVPNKHPGTVSLRELLRSKEFKNASSNISFAVGKDIYGRVIVTDIAKMPHLLIAGATGSGKSVCINTLIMSILYKSSPDDVKLLMIDPKIVELNVYNGIPHLFCPVVTDPSEAAASLNWAVSEMEKRYRLFKDLGVRNIKGYNDKIKRIENAEDQGYKKMPSMVIIVDEFADLMMVASKDVEKAIMRLAQLARAAGIHIVLATQRPSVNIITGVIKANIPSRIAFSVSSAIDSRTILDMSGAERLIGKGDMLFYPEGYTEPVRLQGAFVSDEEIENVVNFIKENNEKADYDPAVSRAIKQGAGGSGSSSAEKSSKPERDEYFADAARFCVSSGRASAGQLQRKFSIGFNRAGRVLDQLCEAGIVGESEGTKPRKILVDAETLEQILGSGENTEEILADTNDKTDAVADVFSENDAFSESDIISDDILPENTESAE